MVFEFRNKDTEYLKWLAENPSGFVLNTRKTPDPNYMVLHKATCRTVCAYPNMEDNPGGFTEKSYVKIFAPIVADLREWAKAHGRKNGTFSKECGICKPQG